MGFNRKFRVWALDWNSVGSVNSSENFDRGWVGEIPWIVKVKFLELSEFVTLSMMKLELDQPLLGTLNVSEKVPC